MTDKVVHLFDHVSIVTGFQWAVCGQLLNGTPGTLTNRIEDTTCEHCKGMPRPHRSKYRDRHN